MIASALAVKNDADVLRLGGKIRFNERMKNVNPEELRKTDQSVKTKSKFGKLKKIKSEKREMT